jgi:hypothetical protein
LNADPKVPAFWGLDGEERCVGAPISTRKAVLRVSAAPREMQLPLPLLLLFYLVNC